MNETEKLILDNQIAIMHLLRRIKEICSDANLIAEGEFTEDFEKVKIQEEKINELISK
jgi:ABC-type uncharacterized transport system ATPase subunit